jgi:hypothetical protein
MRGHQLGRLSNPSQRDPHNALDAIHKYAIHISIPVRSKKKRRCSKGLTREAKEFGEINNNNDSPTKMKDARNYRRSIGNRSYWGNLDHLVNPLKGGCVTFPGKLK